MSKRKHNDSTNAASDAPACVECGSFELVHDSGDTYCGDCGTVADALMLTADYSFDAEHSRPLNYIPHRRHVDHSNPAAVRFNNYWSRERTKQGHAQIDVYIGQLQLAGLAERAKRIFDDYIKRRMNACEARAFGSLLKQNASACVYVAAQEASRQVNLVDLARVTRCSIFEIGREAKNVLWVLGIRTPPLDPLLRAETTVNRVFGCVRKTTGDLGFRKEVLQLISGTAKKKKKSNNDTWNAPELLLRFLARSGHVRAKLIALTARLMDFYRTCALSTGINPNTLACAAIALGIEHLFGAAKATEAEEETTTMESGIERRSQRVCIYKLVALPNGTGYNAVSRHGAAAHRALIEASKTVPWLAGVKMNTDAAVRHLDDILFCYQNAQAWVFNSRSEEEPGGGAGNGSKEGSGDGIARAQITGVMARLGKAPAFVRAETKRQHRQQIIDKCERDAVYELSTDELPVDEGKREVEVVRRLLKLGFDRNALLTLPAHTLEGILPAATRSHNSEYSGLDECTVGPNDMSDEEIRAYLHSGHR